jgi:cyclic beta-1,2-glucan synthetase
VATRLDSAFFGRTRGAPVPERPFRDELLSVERLDERARSLAARFTVDPSRRAARSVFPRFDDNVRLLREAYRTLAGDVRRGEFVTAAAEWLLDNYHLVASEIRDVRRTSPAATTASSRSSRRASRRGTPASTRSRWS